MPSGESEKVSDGAENPSVETAPAPAGSSRMQDFLPKILESIPNIRTKLQYGIGVIAVLAYIYIHSGAETPVLPQIFIFAVVPLLLAMQLIEALTKKQQFVVILVISAVSFAFLATGVTLAVLEKTYRFQQTYNNTTYPLERELDARYLEANKDKIPKDMDYPKYRELILDTAKADDAVSLEKKIEQIVNAYEDYLSCRQRIQCWPSNQFDQRIADFWYTFRPLIEEWRLSFWGASFAKTLQAHAEGFQPPIYPSAVQRDPITGKTTLVSTVPLRGTSG